MGSSIRILHVDDDPEFAATTASYLESKHEQFSVETEHGAADALDAIKRAEGFDCIVSDYQMPKMDGIEFLRALQRQYPVLAVPFILLTGKGNEEVAADALNAGASSYVQKGGPDAYEHLAERIKHDVQIERATRISEQFDTLVSALNDPVYVMDGDGQFTFINDAMVELVGYDREELVGSGPELIKDEAAVEKAERQLARLLSDDGPDDVTFEVTINSKQGEAIPCEDHMGVLPYRGGAFQGSLGVIRDISERKERERELLESKERYQRLVEQNLVGLYIVRDGELIYHNEEFANLLGYPAEPNTLVGQSFGAFVEPEDRERLIESLTNLEAGKVGSVRQPLIASTAEGGTINVEVLGRGITLGEEPAVIGTLVDVGKDEQQYWELRRERDRLEEFTSIISHDLRNPLNVAQLQLSTAARRLEDEEVLDSLDSVESALDRMEELLEDLLALARQGRTVDEREPLGLSNLARDTWDNVATENTELTVSASGTIQADHSRIKGLFENLYRNAVEHAGRDVTVEVGDLDDGFYVEDDGVGVDPDERDQIFESGYTTADGGTGFGLAIVNEIVEAHGWRISVTEGSDGGARFEIRSDNRPVRTGERS